MASFRKSALFFAALAVLMLASGTYSQQHPPEKKNSRPGTDKSVAGKNAGNSEPDPFVPVYTYEFEKPEFLVSRVLVVHDENGHGTVTFEKSNFEEGITEGLQLSAKTLNKIRALWSALDFLNSSEQYQSPLRDYAHLGTMTLKMNRDGKERTAALNWTEIPEVKELTDEYKRIGNQVIWKFDMDVARRNQPLETPRIVKKLDTYFRLNSISDKEQMLPYLKELTNDERLPLIARNHAARLIKDIEKGLGKKN